MEILAPLVFTAIVLFIGYKVVYPRVKSFLAKRSTKGTSHSPDENPTDKFQK